MHVAGILVGWMLLGQASGQPSMDAQQLAAEAVSLPAGSRVSGQPLGLRAVLEACPDRRRQAEAVQAYWQLTQAVAEYRYCFLHAQATAQLTAGDRDRAMARAAQSAAAARLHEAELDVVRAQHDLAGFMQSPAGGPAPLPSDRPHVGAYRTSVKELYAGRTPPEPVQLTEKILPLMQKSIEHRATAVQAAGDALAAVTEDYRRGRASMAAVVTCGAELLAEQQAFMRAARDYNQRIADYGLMVMPVAASPQTLAAVLIGPSQPTAEPARRTETADSPPRYPLREARNEPTKAVPRGGWRRNEPTLAQPRGTKPDRPPETSSPELEPVEVAPPSLPPATSSPPLPRTTRKPVTEGSGFGIQGSANASPAVQAKQLTLAIHEKVAPNNLPNGKSLSLRDCLLRDAGGNRLATLDAYWLAWRRAAQCEILDREADLLKNLVEAALERRNDPSGAADMVRLHAKREAAKATVAEARASLAEAEYALALRLGAVAEGDWPRPSTAPHWGDYLLRLDSQPRAVVESRPAQRLAATLPGLGENVRQHATALVEADTARTTSVERYRRREASMEDLLDVVSREIEQTVAFLDALVDYNHAIAEYVLLVVPANTPADRLVTALVVKP